MARDWSVIAGRHFGVDAIVPPGGVVDADTPAEAPELFLVITRRSPGNEVAEELTTRTAFEQVDSTLMNLGRLDVLSPREHLREAEGACSGGAGGARAGRRVEG